MTRNDLNWFNSNQISLNKGAQPRRALALLGQAVFLMVALGLFTIPASASLTNAYVTQSGTASGGCTSSVHATSWFNSGANWGSGASQVGPGTTVLICGTITTPLTMQGSGASGNPIKIQWDAGASVQACSATGAVQIAGLSNLILDLGGNTAAIECPNNGSVFGSQAIVAGITDGFGGTFSNVEIRNGTIGPIYQKSGNGGDGLGTYLIYVGGGSNDYFHDLTFTDSEKGIMFALSGTSSGNQIAYSTFRNIGADIYYACGGPPCADSGGQIYGNDFTVGVNWGNPGDYTHMESVHVFPNGGGTSITGLLVYNNYTHGAWPAIGGTAALFFETASSSSNDGVLSAEVFNNLCVMTGGATAPGDGCIFSQAYGQTISIYNNTSDCVSNSNSSGKGIELDSQSNDVFKVENNLTLNCSAPFYLPNSGGTVTADYNDWYNTGSNGFFWNGNAYDTFAQYQSAASPQETHSITTNPMVNSDYTLEAGSPVIGLGANLSVLNLSPLDTSKPLTVGTGDEGILGAVRVPVGNWDLGAYAFNNALRPNPPTAVAVISVQ
jgi:hypothetical protein